MAFIVVEERKSEGSIQPWFNIEGKDCDISIEKRPSYCDRGNWIAKLHPRGRLALDIDEADCWPRYYFGWSAMLDEIQAWLEKRGQMPEPAVKVLR